MQGRSDNQPGGTAMVEESNSSIWIGLVALLVVGAAVAWFALGSEKSAGSTSAATATAEPAEASNTTAPTEATGTNEDVGMAVEERPPTQIELREQALASFKESLKEARLWSTVSVEGTVLSLTSGACADENMQPTIAKAASELSGLGFTAIRCHEKHGEQVFEQVL